MRGGGQKTTDPKTTRREESRKTTTATREAAGDAGGPSGVRRDPRTQPACSTYRLICTGSERRPGGSAPPSLRCLLFQVRKTERPTGTFSCCFPDPTTRRSLPLRLFKAGVKSDEIFKHLCPTEEKKKKPKQAVAPEPPRGYCNGRLIDPSRGLLAWGGGLFTLATAETFFFLPPNLL